MKDPSHTIRTAAPLAPIRLGTREGDARHARVQLALLVFMRAVALLWMFEGFVHWADLLLDGSGQPFAALSSQRIAAVFFFCVLDFVAGIGLWLATSWGGVVWFVTVGVQLLALAVLPGFWRYPIALVASDAILVAAYLVLAWQAGHEKPADA